MIDSGSVDAVIIAVPHYFHLMNTEVLVELAVYDLSHGMAKQYLGSMLGVNVEAIYHTGVRVYGYEYFYSDGIQKMTPAQVQVVRVSKLVG